MNVRKLNTKEFEAESTIFSGCKVEVDVEFLESACNALLTNTNETKFKELMDKTEFTTKELRSIQKAGLEEKDILNLLDFYNRKKQQWSNRLIMNSFLIYRENIEAIMNLEDWLYEQMICDDRHSYNIQTLNRLAEIIQTEEDKSLFIDICEAQPTKNHFLLHAYHDLLRAKNEPVFKNIDELEKIQFGKNYDEVMKWRANSLTC